VQELVKQITKTTMIDHKTNRIFIKLAVFACFFYSSTSTSKEQRSINYAHHMQQLVNIAQNSAAKTPFAAMIVDSKSGEILCIDTNPGTYSPIDHGEIEAIRNCSDKYQDKMRWRNTTLISTAEPCPMCQGAISWANISTVVYGTSIPYLIENGWRQLNLRAYEIASRSTFNRTKIIGGVLADQTDRLFDRRSKKENKHNAHQTH
tara:strand:+ start:301 stop:915 length:615 start_codon:yes stop_codon:yes gene_type:complete